MVLLSQKTVKRFLKKLKVRLPYDPDITLLGTNPKELKTGLQRDICTSVFIATLFKIPKRWKKPKYSLMDEKIF